MTGLRFLANDGRLDQSLLNLSQADLDFTH